MCVIVIAS